MEGGREDRGGQEKGELSVCNPTATEIAWKAFWLINEGQLESLIIVRLRVIEGFSLPVADPVWLTGVCGLGY